MDMRITFPGGKKVDANYKGFNIRTDQPVAAGGEESALEPFSYFLVSLGTCAGYYALSFCQQRNISTNGIQLILRTERNELTHMINTVHIEIQVPDSFPEKYYKALIKATNSCAVKKHLETPPKIHTTVKKT